MLKNKIKQFAFENNIEQAEVYFMLAPIVAAIAAFILASVLLQSFFLPMVFITGIAIVYIVVQAVNAVVQSAGDFMDVFLQPHEEF